MSEQFPVTIAVRRPDGSVENVRVGTATRTSDGFSLQLGQLSIGAAPDTAARPRPAASASSAAPSAPRASFGGAPTNFPNYGRSKGAPIAGASLTDLEYYANGARRSLADQSKSRFHDKERELLAAIDAELARQGHGDASLPPMPADGPRWSPPAEPEPPPLTDDDIPF